MANTVAYTFRLNDQFTRASRTIGVSGDRLRRKMDGISKGFRAAKGAALGAAAALVTKCTIEVERRAEPEEKTV